MAPTIKEGAGFVAKYIGVPAAIIGGIIGWANMEIQDPYVTVPIANVAGLPDGSHVKTSGQLEQVLEDGILISSGGKSMVFKRDGHWLKNGQWDGDGEARDALYNLINDGNTANDGVTLRFEVRKEGTLFVAYALSDVELETGGVKKEYNVQ